MIDRADDDLSGAEPCDVWIVRSPTGQLVGFYWGSQLDICHAVDEVTDPNGCERKRCEPGGVRFGCFLDVDEISVQEYGEHFEAALADDEDDELEFPDVAFEGFTEECLENLLENGILWQPLVPNGYQYIAGFGLRKIESEWN